MKNISKILFVTPLPPPVHGSAMVSQYIKDSQLVQSEFDCDFVNLSTSRRMDEIGKGGMKKIFRFIGSYFALFFKLLTHRYDLCYLAITCHGVGFLKDAPFVLLCKLFRRKVVIHQHNKGMSRCVDKQPYKWLLPLVYRNTKVILLSWYLYPDIEKVVSREQVLICPNGIPDLSDKLRAMSSEPVTSVTSDLQSEVEGGRGFVNPQLDSIGLQIRCDKGCDKDREFSGEGLVDHPDGDTTHYTQHTTQTNGRVPRLLFLSNLIESKGVYVLLDACKILKDKGLRFVCNFVGGETKEINREIFEEETRKRGLDEMVAYQGPKYGKEKEICWHDADVFVQPTLEDCFPLTIVEAMQHAKPVVSTNEGAIPDIIEDGVNGFVCERKDVNGIAQATEKLLHDATLREQMGRHGYETYSKEFTLDRFEQRFVEIVKKCLAGGVGTVNYLGSQYGEDKLACLKAHDILVFPTYYYNECFPLVILEAMQQGLAIVTTNEGGIPDVVKDGENGFICGQKDAKSLADALEKLITNPALRQQMGEKGYARYRKEYTLEVFERRFVECLEFGV